MINLDNKVLTLENDLNYEIIDYVIYENNVYVYLVNINDELDTMFKEIKNINNKFIIEDIDNKLFEEIILKLFYEKFNSY